MSDIATISLRVDTSGLVAGNKALDDFQETATDAAKKADDLNSCFKAGAVSQKQSAASIKEQRQELQNLLNKISPVNRALNDLDDLQDKLRSAQRGGLLPHDDYTRYNQILETTRDKLGRVQQAETAEGRALLEAEAAAARATATRERFIQQLKNQVAAQTLSRTELLRQKAAQLGAGSAAEVYIKKLEQAGEQTHQLGLKSAGARREIGILIGELARGDLGALRGSGITLANQAGWIDQLLTLRGLGIATVVGGIAGAVYSLGKAAYEGNKELEELKKNISNDLGLRGDFATQVAADIKTLSDVTGQATEQIKDSYIATKDGANEAILKLIKVGYTYDEARDKVEAYKESSILIALNGDIDKHIQKVAELKQSWVDVVLQKAKAMGGVLIGQTEGTEYAGKKRTRRGSEVDDLIEQAKERQKEFNELIVESNTHVANTAASLKEQYLQTNRIAKAQQELNQLLEKQKTISGSGDAEAKNQAQYLIEQKRKEIEQLQKQENKQNKPKAYTDDAATKMLQTSKERLASLLSQQGVTSQMTAEEKRLVEFNQQIANLKKKDILTADQKSLVARSDEIKASLELEASTSKRIEDQKKLNQLYQQSTRFAEQQAAKRAEIQAKLDGKSSREAARDAERDRVKTTYAANPEARDKALKELEETYRKEDELRGSWLAGAQSAWNEYYESATNAYSAVHDVAGAAIGGLSGMLDDLVMTGKTSFKSFAASMMKMIVQVIDQLLIAYALQKAMGWITGSVSTGGGSTPSGAYDTAAGNLHFSGGGYTGDGGKYEPKGVVHGGEFVFTKEATRAIGVDNLYAMMKGAQGYANGGYVGKAPMAGLKGGSSAAAVAPVISVSVGDINIGNEGQKNTGSAANAAAIGRQIKDAMVETINTQVRKPGTPLWNALRGR